MKKCATSPLSRPSVRTTFQIPIAHSDAGKQNGYRVVPWASVNGESAGYPFPTESASGVFGGGDAASADASS